MEPSKTTPSSALTATVQEIQSYPGYVKRNLSNTLPASFNDSINALVKTGQLTQAQAIQVMGCNQMSMFGTLLDALQNQDNDDSSDITGNTDSLAASGDPFSILLDAFKENDETEKSDSPLFDSLAGLMPAYDSLGRPTLASAKSSGSTLYDELSSLVQKAALTTPPSAKGKTGPEEKNSTIHASVDGLTPNA